MTTQPDTETALGRPRAAADGPIALRATAAGGLTAAPSSMDDVYRLAHGLSRSGLIRNELRGKPDDVAVILLTSLELGVPMMTGLRQIAVINGKPFVESALLTAICLSHPEICEYVRPVAVTDNGAAWEAKRRGWDEPILAEFTRADAERAGLLSKKGPWQEYPRDMMSWRACARACRTAFPDLVGGMYVTGEYEVLDVEQIPDQAERVAARIEAAVAEPAGPIKPYTPPPKRRRRAEPTVDAAAVPEPERATAGPDPAGATGMLDPMLDGLEEP